MCLFCRIATKEIPSRVVLDEPDLFAFHDVNAVAPTHVLIIPKRHIEGLSEIEPEDQVILGRLVLATRKVAEATGIAQDGFRVVINSGPSAGQSVFHVHVHVLGGRPMSWPPG